MLNRFNRPQDVPILKIVSAARLADPMVGDGRLIPVLTLDFSESPQLSALLEFHGKTPGDVISTWTMPKFKRKYIYLFLKFTKPVELIVAIEFKVEEHYASIDGIALNRSMYIRSSESSMRLTENMNASSILLEIPEETEPKFWDDLYHKTMIKRLKKKGISRNLAPKLAKERIAEAREVWNMRMNIT